MKISIVTAVYNRAETITDALRSVETQSYQSFEHIVQDGGSTDGTLDIVRQLAGSSTLLVSEPDHGLYDAINRGIQRASGDVVGLMHSDDIFADTDVLARVARGFENPTVDGIYGDLDYVAAEDTTRVIRRWRSGTYSPNLLRIGWMPPHPTMYLRRGIFEQHGLYDTTFSISADYDAMLRYLTKGRINLLYIPETLVKMRVGGESNRSLERIFLKSREDYRAIRTNGVGGLGTLTMKNLSKIRQFF